jgi:hypothetical protein
MLAIGIIVGLIGAAVGIVASAVGGLVGIAFGLLGGCVGLLPHLLPVVLITIGIIWLVKGSNARNVTGARANQGDTARPQRPCTPR